MRLVAFSDGVFAITATLLILEIKPPADDKDLLHGLAVLWPSYVAYALTFLFIGQVWANHHVMFDHVRAADRVILFLNTLLLMIVAFLPFATSVLSDALHSGLGQRTAVVLYGIAFDATALTFNAVWQYARRHLLLSKTLDATGVRAIARRFQFALGWLAVGALLGAALPLLGVAIIAAFNAFYWLPIRGELPRRTENQMSATVTLERRAPGGVMELRRNPFQVILDGGPAGSIGRNQTIELPVEPGRHTLQVRTGRYSSQLHSFDAAERTNIRFRCNGTVFSPHYVASLIVPTIGLELQRE